MITERRVYDYHVTKEAGTGVFAIVMFVCLGWFILARNLWIKNRLLGIAFVGLTFVGLSAARYGAITQLSDADQAKRIALPRCYQTDSCNFMSEVPLEQQ